MKKTELKDMKNIYYVNLYVFTDEFKSKKTLMEFLEDIKNDHQEVFSYFVEDCINNNCATVDKDWEFDTLEEAEDFYNNYLSSEHSDYKGTYYNFKWINLEITDEDGNYCDEIKFDFLDFKDTKLW